MSEETVRAVLRRAQVDDDFYLSLRRDPQEALAEYELSEDEREAIIRQDQSLYRYLVPSLSAVPERAISIVITITGEHDWFNVARLRHVDAVPTEALETISELARRVIGREGGRRLEQLMTILQLLDGREG